MLQFENDRFNAMEHAVIEAICLEQPPPVGEGLLAQWKVASFTSRTMTGAGFFTYMNVLKDDAEPVDDALHQIGNLRVKLDTLQYDCGCLLFLKAGYLHVLECFTYDEKWPATVSHFEIMNAQAR